MRKYKDFKYWINQNSQWMLKYPSGYIGPVPSKSEDEIKILIDKIIAKYTS